MPRLSPALLVGGFVCLVAYGCLPTENPRRNNAARAGGRAGAGGAGGTGGATSGESNGGSTTGSGGVGSGGSVGTGGAGVGGSSGGRAGAGDSTAAGGGASSGGQTGRGGSSASGGATSKDAGGSGSGGAYPSDASVSTSCTFTQTGSASSKIPTVGIVTWSTTLSSPKSAKIDFGLTTSYGFTAPVDLTQKDYRTLLLGMKQNKTYHYRITATGTGGDCSSPDYTITTGQFPNGVLPQITVSTKNASALYGGFLIIGQYVSMGGGGGGSPAYILDADSEFVWAYQVSSDATGVRMDYAGTHIWINNANVPDGGASVHRVTTDGIEDQNLSSKFTGLNHQLTILPDETVAFYAYASSGCEDIKEYTPSTGNVKTIVNSGKAQGTSSQCHVNNIQYSKDDDTLVFSDLDNQTVTKVKRSDGSTVWVLGGSKATFTGDGWKGGEHGVHLLGLDRFLLFNNNSQAFMGGTGGGGTGGDGTGSIAIEFKLDLSAKKISNVWSYKASPGIDNSVMGDLQRLPNGNTIVGYSTSGVLHEVDSKGTVLQTLTWKNLTQFGYIEKRASLYGPPPR